MVTTAKASWGNAMLQLYLGRAKSGKTAAVTQAIRARVDARVGGSVLLVPEWYSYEAEIELLRSKI